MKTDGNTSNKILYVDDEEAWRVVFKRNLDGVYDVITAKNADEGWELLKKHANEIAIVVSDQRMPGRPGIELLKQARAYHPRIIRILTTGFSDSTIAIHATNQGAVYHYVSKPWNGDELLSILKRAMDFHLIRQERDNLLQRKLSLIQRKNLESKFQNLLVFGDSKKGEMAHVSEALNCFLESIFQDPGKIFSLKGIYRNSQDEIGVLAGNLRLIQKLMDVPARLLSVKQNSEVDSRKILLPIRDQYSQIIFSVQNLGSSCEHELNSAEEIVSYYLNQLVAEWMLGDGQKLLEVAEKRNENVEDTFSIRIGYFNDAVPYEGSEDDPLFNGINLSESQELAWIRFLLVVYHFGGKVVPDIISSKRLSFRLSLFDALSVDADLSSEVVIAELLRKFEQWNYSSIGSVLDRNDIE